MNDQTRAEGKGAGFSRRRAIGACSVAIASVVSGSALGRGEAGRSGPGRRDGDQGRPTGDFRDRFKRMRNATDEERHRMMMEMSVRRRQETIERYQKQLGCTAAEWQVIKPRLEAVYERVRPIGRSVVSVGMGGPDASEVDTRKRQLREVLRQEAVKPDQIKAGLTALRVARKKAARELTAARQSLRQLLTLRQEAELVLAGLLV